MIWREKFKNILTQLIKRYFLKAFPFEYFRSGNLDGNILNQMKENKENGIEHHDHAKDEVALMNNQVWLLEELVLEWCSELHVE
jgi:hypothetical protein